LGFTHECHLFSLFPFLVVNAVGIIISQEIELIAKSAVYNLIQNKFNYLRPIINRGPYWKRSIMMNLN